MNLSLTTVGKYKEKEMDKEKKGNNIRDNVDTQRLGKRQLLIKLDSHTLNRDISKMSTTTKKQLQTFHSIQSHRQQIPSNIFSIPGQCK